MTTLLTVQSQSPPREDGQLALEARSDREAFAELYRRHVNRVYRYHMAHTGDPNEAEDLTSQTFMAALEGIRSFRGDGSFAAWIMGISARKKAMHFRGKKTEIPLGAALQVQDPGLSIDQEADQRMQREEILRALRRIGRDRAEALALYFFGGLSIAETSQVMGRSKGAVKMLISRGLHDLRERISFTHGGEG